MNKSFLGIENFFKYQKEKSHNIVPIVLVYEKLMNFTVRLLNCPVMSLVAFYNTGIVSALTLTTENLNQNNCKLAISKVHITYEYPITPSSAPSHTVAPCCAPLCPIAPCHAPAP